MNYYFCDFCRYCFSAEKMPDRCPDCGAVAYDNKKAVRLIKFIHGYGSSGKGGKIRIAARRELETLQKRGYVKAIIYGEKLSIFDEDTRRALAHCGELRGDPDFERHNNGVTLIML